MENGEVGDSIRGSGAYACVLVASTFFVLGALALFFFFMTAMPFSLHGKVT